MSDDVIRTLGKFTPGTGGLDRDALLFAAGRASRKTPWGWKVACVLLAAGWLVTLGWPERKPSDGSPPRTAVAADPPLESPGSPAYEPDSYLMLSRSDLLTPKLSRSTALPERTATPTLTARFRGELIP